MRKIEEIYANVLPELEKAGVEDTTEHRLWALEGLYDGWTEDPNLPPEAMPWLLACRMEIIALKMRLIPKNWVI